MRWLVLCLCLLPAVLSGPALAQDKAQTLADIKTELGQLQAQFSALKAELVKTGAATNGAAGGDALQRMDAIEAELTQLTARTEDIENKLKKVVADGTNRIGDIEFRLCEQTKGCDPANMPPTQPLGGGDATAAAPAATAGTGGTAGAAAADNAPELAIGEQSDFDKAKAAFVAGDYQAAVDKFKAFDVAYPGSPLAEEADFDRGEALNSLGNTADAARAYLDAFSAKPDGPMAAQSLLKLGQALGTLGQVPDACVTLAEVGNRFAGTISATNAQVSMQGLGCK